MHSPFHAVARGLRLTLVGFLLTCWGGGSALGIGWMWDKTYYGNQSLRLTLLYSLWGAIIAAVVGVVVGFVGRIRCLKMPKEFPAIRGRALAAVALEGSGWGSLFVGVGVLFAMGYNLLPRAEWVPAIGMLISGLMLFGGRVMFLRFLWVLGREVEDRVSARYAKWSLILFLTDWAVALIGVGISAGGSVLGVSELANPLAFLVWIAAGMSGLAGLFLYDRLLNGLAKAVQAFADDHPPDEEERRNLAQMDEEEGANLRAEPAKGD